MLISVSTIVPKVNYLLNLIIFAKKIWWKRKIILSLCHNSKTTIIQTQKLTIMAQRSLCEVQMSYKPKLENGLHPQIRSDQDVYDLRWELYSEDTISYREQFFAVYLNRAGRLIGFSRISEGGTCSTIVDIRMIMQQALLCNAASIVLTHNHPSGSPYPSIEDDRVTSRVAEAAKLFDIVLHDHIIVTANGCYAYKSHGRI